MAGEGAAWWHMASAMTSVCGGRMSAGNWRLLTPVTDQRWSGESRVELLTNLREDFTITEKAPTSAFTFKTFKTGGLLWVNA